MQTEADLEAWRVDYREVVESTQAVARGLRPWSAIVALEQTSGRGQFDRSFVSDLGGLYLTAVLPYAGDPMAARGFALAIGWAVRDVLGYVGVSGVRLRWPNDLMVGSRKVGGILVEQGGRDTLLVGVGLNVRNTPWKQDPLLVESAGSLGDIGGAAILDNREDTVHRLLKAIRNAHSLFGLIRLAGFARTLNTCWGPRRHVELELAGEGVPATESGLFIGVDEEGALILHQEGGREVKMPAHYVRRLRELE